MVDRMYLEEAVLRQAFPGYRLQTPLSERCPLFRSVAQHC